MKGEADPDLLFGSGQHFDRIAVGYSDTVDMPERQFLRQSVAPEGQKSAQELCDRFGILSLRLMLHAVDERSNQVLFKGDPGLTAAVLYEG